MLIAAADTLIRPSSRIYFYYCTILVISFIVVSTVKGGAVMEDGEPRGTVLNNRLRIAGTCLNPDDPRMIEARKVFQDLIPYRKKRFEALSDEAVRSILLYISSVSKMVEKMATQDEVYSAAWYDTAGDYLHSYLLPVSKYCFYSGNVSYYSVRSVLEYYRKVKLQLDTNGNGWAHLNLNSEGVQSTILAMKHSQNSSNCSELDFYSSADIPLPKAEFDDDSQAIISLWVPLKSRQVYDPRSKSSLSILRVYYETVVQCIPEEKPPRKSFPNRFVKWIEEDLAKHLLDEEFYPGLESILRIKKTLEAAITTKLVAKKSIAEEGEDESGSEEKGFFENLFNLAEPGDVQEDYEDEEQLDQRRLFFIKFGITAIGVALVVLVVIVLIVKMCKNRSTIKRKAEVMRSKSWNRKKFFKRKDGNQSDEEVLLALDKQPESGWKYNRKSSNADKIQQLNPRFSKQMPPFTDTEEDDEFEAFQPKKISSERIPLIAKDKKRKPRCCGRGCICMNCVGKSKNGAGESQDLLSNSTYRLVKETADKPENRIDSKKVRTEEPVPTNSQMVNRNPRGGNTSYKAEAWKGE